MNINPAYQPKELLYCLNKVGIRAMVNAESFKTQDYYAMMAEIIPELPLAQPGRIESEATPDLRHVIMISDKDFRWRILLLMLLLGRMVSMRR